jgi:hypothetical protein
MGVPRFLIPEWDRHPVRNRPARTPAASR